MEAATNQTEFQRLADEPVESLGDAAILDELPAVPDAFRVNSAASANWLVRRVNDSRARAERAKEWAAKEVARAAREEEFFLRVYGAELEAWVRGNPPHGKKSVNMPAGSAGFRSVPERLAFDDDTAAARWAEDHAPAACVVVPAVIRPDKKALAALYKTQGLVPDGCHVEEAAEKFSVR